MRSFFAVCLGIGVSLILMGAGVESNWQMALGIGLICGALGIVFAALADESLKERKR